MKTLAERARELSQFNYRRLSLGFGHMETSSKLLRECADELERLGAERDRLERLVNELNAAIGGLNTKLGGWGQGL